MLRLCQHKVYIALFMPSAFSGYLFVYRYDSMQMCTYTLSTLARNKGTKLLV